MASSLPALRALTSIALLVLSGCSEDAVIDISIVSADGRPLDNVDVVVCSALRSDDVVGRVTVTSGGEGAALTLPADGRAVRVAAFSGALCGASCQTELDPGAELRGELVLSPCLVCPSLPAGASSVCQDPGCFVATPQLSLCE